MSKIGSEVRVLYLRQRTNSSFIKQSTFKNNKKYIMNKDLTGKLLKLS